MPFPRSLQTTSQLAWLAQQYPIDPTEVITSQKTRQTSTQGKAASGASSLGQSVTVTVPASTEALQWAVTLKETLKLGRHDQVLHWHCQEGSLVRALTQVGVRTWGAFPKTTPPKAPLDAWLAERLIPIDENLTDGVWETLSNPTLMIALEVLGQGTLVEKQRFLQEVFNSPVEALLIAIPSLSEPPLSQEAWQHFLACCGWHTLNAYPNLGIFPIKNKATDPKVLLHLKRMTAS
jgi:hypothetical protein